jgi:uncharacterized membrane protein SpoIIM required for sporulation
MKSPGEILSEHRFIVLIACIVVFVGIAAGANRSAFESYMENAPEIPWENIPVSALTYFAYNLRNALVSLFGIVLAFLSGFGLGLSLGVSLWLVSQNTVYVVVFSHGILEVYSVFLAMVGGLLILAKAGEALRGFFGSLSQAPRSVDWRKVAQDYGSLFLSSVFGLFISAWLEAVLSWAILHLGSYFWLVAVGNTLISVSIVGVLSFARKRSRILSAMLRVLLISAVTYVCVLSMIWSYCAILVVTGPGPLTFLPALVFGFIATFVSTIVLNSAR